MRSPILHRSPAAADSNLAPDDDLPDIPAVRRVGQAGAGEATGDSYMCDSLEQPVATVAMPAGRRKAAAATIRTMSPARPIRRRWYQFGLGTMFVAVTVISAFLGYYLNWIRQRHAVVGDRAYHLVLAPPPGLLFVFAERGYREIGIELSETGVSRQAKLIEAERIAQLFPEVQELNLSYPTPPSIHFERPQGSVPNSATAPTSCASSGAAVVIVPSSRLLNSRPPNHENSPPRYR